MLQSLRACMRAFARAVPYHACVSCVRACTHSLSTDSQKSKQAGSRLAELPTDGRPRKTVSLRLQSMKTNQDLLCKPRGSGEIEQKVCGAAHLPCSTLVSVRWGSITLLSVSHLSRGNPSIPFLFRGHKHSPISADISSLPSSPALGSGSPYSKSVHL